MKWNDGSGRRRLIARDSAGRFVMFDEVEVRTENISEFVVVME